MDERRLTNQSNRRDESLSDSRRPQPADIPGCPRGKEPRNLTKEELGEVARAQAQGRLPPLKVDDEVSDDAPHVAIGRRKASMPPPVMVNPDEQLAP